MGSILMKHESETLSKLTSTYTIRTVANQPNEHVFGLVENPHRHRKNSPAPHTQRPQKQAELFLVCGKSSREAK